MIISKHWWFVDRVKWGKRFLDQFVIVCEEEFEGIYSVYLVDSNCILRFLNYTPFLNSSSPYPFLPHSFLHIPSFPQTHILSYTFLSSHTHSYIYLPFLKHTSFHIPSFPPTLNLSYTHTIISSRTHPFIYLPFLTHSYFHITSFPLKFNFFISTHTFLSSRTHPFIYPLFPFLRHSSFYYTFLSYHTHPWIHLIFLPHSTFHTNPLFFPPHTLIRPFLTSSSSSTLTLIQPWINPFISLLLSPKPYLF